MDRGETSAYAADAVTARLLRESTVKYLVQLQSLFVVTITSTLLLDFQVWLWEFVRLASITLGQTLRSGTDIGQEGLKCPCSFQRCSWGLRSGLRVGHLRSFTPILTKYVFMELAVVLEQILTS